MSRKSSGLVDGFLWVGTRCGMAAKPERRDRYGYCSYAHGFEPRLLGHVQPRSLSVLVASALLLAGATRATAQEHQWLHDVSAKNVITSYTVVQLSLLGLDVAADVNVRVFRLPDGGWGVSGTASPRRVQCFSPAGAPRGDLARSERELRALDGDVLAVPIRGDLWVLDPRNARLSILTKELEIVGERRLNVRPFFVSPGGDSASVLVSGSAYVRGIYYAVARIALDSSKDVFGVPLGRNPLPASQWLIKRRMATATSDSEVWAVAMSGGAVDVLRNSDLSLLTQLELPGEEMSREAQWQLTNFDRRPAPRLLGLGSDATGLLWVTFAVADQRWTSGMDPRTNVEKYFDTRILAIDTMKRAVVGTLQLDAVCMPVERNLLSCTDELARTIRIVALRLHSYPHGEL